MLLENDEKIKTSASIARVCVCVCVCSVSQSCLTPCDLCQAPLSIEFSRQEYWSGFPFPSPGDLPDPGIKPTSLALTGRFFTTEPPVFCFLFSCTGLSFAIRDLVPWPGIEPRAPALGVQSLATWPAGKSRPDILISVLTCSERNASL